MVLVYRAVHAKIESELFYRLDGKRSGHLLKTIPRKCLPGEVIHDDPSRARPVAGLGTESKRIHRLHSSERTNSPLGELPTGFIWKISPFFRIARESGHRGRNHQLCQNAGSTRKWIVAPPTKPLSAPTCHARIARCPFAPGRQQDVPLRLRSLTTNPGVSDARPPTRSDAPPHRR